MSHRKNRNQQNRVQGEARKRRPIHQHELHVNNANTEFAADNDIQDEVDAFKDRDNNECFDCFDC